MLCGKYKCRTGGVKHICRYCHCPTEKASDPMAKYPPKKQAAIEKLVQKGKKKQLQMISQQPIQNAWYKVSFHDANDQGIHGACPSEMILLGLFKYLQETFFVNMGAYSQLAEDINGLAKMYGKLFTRQSDRNFPKTNFSKGIWKGKLMGIEYRGVLLLIAAVLRSTAGRAMLMRRKQFGGQDGLYDWILLAELLLEWESYLWQPRMKRQHVKQLGRKNRYIMYLFIQVANRYEGMGLNIFKFHAIVHLTQDALLCGVPTEVDTSANESHHKPTKTVRTAYGFAGRFWCIIC